VKEKVAQRNPSSSLIEAIRNVWVTEVTPELLKTLAMFMPAHIQACLAVHGRLTKYCIFTYMYLMCLDFTCTCKQMWNLFFECKFFVRFLLIVKVHFSSCRLPMTVVSGICGLKCLSNCYFVFFLGLIFLIKRLSMLTY
jgi:hypothetical protein